MGPMEDPTFATLIHKVHFEIADTNSGTRDRGFCKINKMGARKWPFELKEHYLNMGRENGCDRRRSEAEIFLISK